MAHVIAGENDGPIRLDQGLVTGIDMGWRLGKAGPPLLPGSIGSYPRTLIVGYLAPGYIHRLFQFLAVPGMQALDRLAAFRQTSAPVGDLSMLERPSSVYPLTSTPRGGKHSGRKETRWGYSLR